MSAWKNLHGRWIGNHRHQACLVFWTCVKDSVKTCGAQEVFSFIFLLARDPVSSGMLKAMKSPVIFLLGMVVLGQAGFGQDPRPVPSPDPEASPEAARGPMLEAGGEPTLTATVIDVVPTIISSNLPRTRQFFTGMLGFQILQAEAGGYMAFGRDAVRVGVAANPSMTPANRGTVYFTVSGIDVFHDELQSRGVKMSKPIETKSSKMREFTVLDPDNNTLIFGEYTGR
jgi:predicted enzyme related to lactoylglutathione lyase